MTIEFFMPMVPPTATAQMHKINKKTGCFYDPPEVKAMKAKLTAHLAQHRPKAPMTGPLMLIVDWAWPSDSEHEDGTPKTTRPDTDNLQKALKDIMTKLGFWTDDALVFAELVTKSHSDTPGIYIKIEEVNL